MRGSAQPPPADSLLPTVDFASKRPGASIPSAAPTTAWSWALPFPVTRPFEKSAGRLLINCLATFVDEDGRTRTAFCFDTHEPSIPDDLRSPMEHDGRSVVRVA